MELAYSHCHPLICPVSFLKPLKLAVIMTSRDSEFYRLIMHCVKYLFLPILNLPTNQLLIPDSTLGGGQNSSLHTVCNIVHRNRAHPFFTISSSKRVPNIVAFPHNKKALNSLKSFWLPCFTLFSALHCFFNVWWLEIIATFYKVLVLQRISTGAHFLQWKSFRTYLDLSLLKIWFSKK